MQINPLSTPKDTLPALWVVSPAYDAIRSVLDPLVPHLFTHIVSGNAASDFASDTSTDIVVYIGGTGTLDVLKTFLRPPGEPQRIQWVHSSYTGVDAFGLASLAPQLEHIPVSNARGVFSTMLAEHVVFAVLYFNRELPRLLQQHQDHHWDRFPSKKASGQCVGIIGYGNIGQQVAESVHQGLHMEVMGWRRTVQRSTQASQSQAHEESQHNNSGPGNDDSSQQANTHIPVLTHDAFGTRLVYGEEGLTQLLGVCDFVVMVLPLTDSTKHMISQRHFALMKPSAVLINIGRGATLVEADLVQALHDGAIHGAALDVFAEEPLPAQSVLWDVSPHKLFLTPHNADVDAAYLQDAARHFGALAERFVLHHEVPSYLVDLRRGY